MVGDDDVLEAAEGWLAQGRGVAVATVIETWGSAPRPVGAHLVMDSDGRFLGSVSGGCVEAEVVAEALDVIATGAPKTLEFGVADETAWKAGLSCGGHIAVYVERAVRLDLLRALNAARRERRAVALVTRLDDGEQRLVAAEALGDDELAGEIAAALRAGRSGGIERAGARYFLNVKLPTARLAMVGAVHIAQALAPIARLAGLDALVIDPRTAFASPERFPDAAVVAEWPDEAFAARPLDRYTAVCLLSHDPRIDDPALIAALRSDCFYVGALGSRKTHARRLERMREAGFGEPALARIQAPIGLDVGAVSPAEIAIAIAAEIIAARRAKPPRDG